MKARHAMGWLAVAATAGGAVAARAPEPSPRDARIGLVDYAEHEVVTVPVARGVVTRIVLAPDEKIIRRFVATGFPASCAGGEHEREWCITAEEGDNQIWVKPLRNATSNNLELRTSRRDYSFHLVVTPGAEKSASAFFRVVFRHPVSLPATSTALRIDPPPARPAGDEASPAPPPATDKPAPRQDYPRPAVRNYDYARKGPPGSEAIAPAVVFDDGRFTYLRFPRGQEVPAVFALGADGGEVRVSTHAERLAPDPARPEAGVERDYLVVHRIASRLLLRLGAASLELINNAAARDGIETHDGTTDPRFIRDNRP